MKPRYRLHWASGTGPRPSFKWAIYDWTPGAFCPIAFTETRSDGRALCDFLNHRTAAISVGASPRSPGLRDEGEPHTPMAHFYGAPLDVTVDGGALVVRIGVQTLAHAASYADWANPYEAESGDYVRTFAITNAEGFANDVRRMLLQEREDGSSLVSDVLDKAMEAAVDDGSEHCEYEQRILHGQTSPLETWVGAPPRSPVTPTPEEDQTDDAGT